MIKGFNQIMMKRVLILIAITIALLYYSCSSRQYEYDTIIRNGMIYDGNGGEPYKGRYWN